MWANVETEDEIKLQEKGRKLYYFGIILFYHFGMLTSSNYYKIIFLLMMWLDFNFLIKMFQMIYL